MGLSNSTMRGARALFAMVSLALLVAAPVAPAVAQPHNYFARTPESERELASNELHHLNRGIASLRKGTANELDNARHDFDFILGRWPNHPQVLALMTETLSRQGKLGMINDYFDRAYRMSPDVSQIYVLHGVTLLRQNRVDEAIARLQRGAELDDSSMNAHYNLGLALVRAKRLNEANVHAQRAYALGHPLPGLRDQLQRAGAWSPAAPEARPGDSGARPN